MKSCLYTCNVMHARYEGAENSFQYPLTMFSFDLDELWAVGDTLKLFGNNYGNVYSIYDADYLEDQPGSIKEKLFDLCRKNGFAAEVSRIDSVHLVTAPRYFGYVFNPATFYFCQSTEGELVLFVLEINNTFGDKHVYMLNDFDAGQPFHRKIRTKKFHVSPFHRMEGQYHFSISVSEDEFAIGIDILRKGEKIFSSKVQGERTELCNRHLLSVTLKSPLRPWLTMPRILWQAFKLHYLKRLPVYKRPNPISSDTIRHRSPGWQERVYMKTVFGLLQKIEVGSLIMNLPDGSHKVFQGTKERHRRARLTVKNYDLFQRVVLGGAVGFGEGYQHGDWESSNLVELLQLLSDNRDSIKAEKGVRGVFKRLVNRVVHASRRNTPEGSRRNVQAHYDLSNDFFRTFLDETMTYSAGYFDDTNCSLYESQRNKLHRMIELSGIEDHHRVLEIGCGWGSLSLEIAKRTGAHVTAVTISEQQFALAKERIVEQGLEDRIDLRLMDYRELDGRFDRIVSVEMLEAVGKEFLHTFFENCAQLLSPEGLLALQVITMPEERIKQYQRGCDWIQRYIFPGCYVPAVSDVCSASSESQLVLQKTENIGFHYARTLEVWRDAFDSQREQIKAQGFDEQFMRTWEYYLAYCEAGFLNQDIGTHQILFTPRMNRTYSNPVGEAKAAKSISDLSYSA